MRIAKNLSDLIGRTPLLELTNLETWIGAKAHLIGKLEYFNPAGSSKDRVAKNMIDTACKEGKLKKGSVIIEPTSGNTGIGLAAVARSRGYRVILTMPDTMSVERRNLLKAYGAELVLTPGELGMKGAIDRANELANEIKDSFIPGQFDNPANTEIHRLTTGPEIWEDTDGMVDVVVAGIGTGGTITGIGEYLKQKKDNVYIVGVEPEGSPYLTKKQTGAHKLQGIGAGFKPSILREDICDEIIAVSDQDAYRMGQNIADTEGLLVGISSGAAVYAAYVLSLRPEFTGKNIVIILPDHGEHYLSTPGYFNV